MIPICLALIPAAFLLACPLTWLMRSIGVRMGQVDRPGERKIHHTPIPATGGVAIFLGVGLPLALGMLAVWFVPDASWPEQARPYLEGARGQTSMGVALLACLVVLHVVGWIDDRRALGPGIKFLVQFGAAGVMAGLFHTRMLELLGPYGSVAVTVLWFVAITNAFNFLDNMDGLSGGVACVCASMFLAAALLNEQWFIAGTLSLLIGSLIGFLVFNFPPATIFMGDAGSLVVGFLMAFCSVRITYLDPSPGSGETPWWGVLTPVVVLAIPLYDLTSVTALRLMQGKSPFVGDTQHFSHRLVSKGLSRRAAVGVIWACTLAAGLGGVMLARLERWEATLVVTQTLAILFVLALLEKKTPRAQTG